MESMKASCMKLQEEQAGMKKKINPKVMTMIDRSDLLSIYVLLRSKLIQACVLTFKQCREEGTGPGGHVQAGHEG